MSKHEVCRRMCFGSYCDRLVCVLLVFITASAGSIAKAQLRPGPRGEQHVGVIDVDRRLTWVHWWEANRDTYLMQTLERDGRAQRQAPPDAEVLNEATEALIEATRVNDKDDPLALRLRIAATLSLGRIGNDQAVDRLLELTGDPRLEVRPSAWLALGASGSAKAREKLLNPGELGLVDRLPRTAALGLLEVDDKQAIALLKGEILDPSNNVSELRRVALQSLRLLQAPELGSISRVVIQRSSSPPEVVEAILALAAEPDQADAALMLSLLNGGPPASRLPIIDTDNEVPWQVRFSSAMVLGRYAGAIHEDRLRKVLLRNSLRTTDTGLDDFYRGPALLTFASVADRDDMDAFEQALKGLTQVNDETDEHRHQRREQLPEREFRRLDDPIRGFAAIAMGLYVRQLGEAMPEQQVVPVRHPHDADRPTRRFIYQLHLLLANARESSDLRAAAAMGLALSNDPGAADLIAQALQEADPKDEMVIGYATLAMVMLGDERGAVLARQYLKRLSAKPSEALELKMDTPTPTVLGRRAMVLALGLVDDDQSVPVLQELFGGDPWVSLEAAKVLSWLENDALGERLIVDLTAEPDQPQGVLAAMGLGELLDSHRPSAMARLSSGGNYALGLGDDVAVKIPVDEPDQGGPCHRLVQPLREYRAPGNVYLYYILLDQ